MNEVKLLTGATIDEKARVLSEALSKPNMIALYVGSGDIRNIVKIHPSSRLLTCGPCDCDKYLGYAFNAVCIDVKDHTLRTDLIRALYPCVDKDGTMAYVQ